VAFATIGWKYYLVFIIVPLAGVPILALYFPETKGLTLEEIGALFGDEVVPLETGNGTSLDEKEVVSEQVNVEKA
jgi:hypothetical protein